MPSHQLTTAFMLPSHANGFMINGLWRGVLGMNETFVSSDCGDIKGLQDSFGLAADDAEASALALNAGVDQDLCVAAYDKGIPAALERGLVSNATLDFAVSNILRHKFAAGLFEGAWKVNPAKVPGQLGKHRQLALESARQGITMLINANGTLPTQFAHKKVLVVGSLANDTEAHVGGYIYASPGVEVTTVWAAVQRECGAAPGCTCEFAAGASPTSFDVGGVAAVAAKVRVGQADLVVAVVGDSYYTASENRDVDDLDLNGAQLPLLWAVTKAAAPRKVPIVTVVLSSQPKTFGASLWTPAGVGKPNAVLGSLSALLAAWRPGQEGGGAVVDILTGRTNPSGRLSHTWPQKAGQAHSVASNSYHMPGTFAATTVKYTTGPAAALFPFGFGLSFTGFALSNATAAAPAGQKAVNASQRFTITVTITGAGPAGSCALGVYARPNFALKRQAYPARRLLCWTLAAVPENGQVTASISCAASDLGMWDLEVGDYVVQGGEWILAVAQCVCCLGWQHAPPSHAAAVVWPLPSPWPTCNRLHPPPAPRCAHFLVRTP